MHTAIKRFTEFYLFGQILFVNDTRKLICWIVVWMPSVGKACRPGSIRQEPCAQIIFLLVKLVSLGWMRRTGGIGSSKCTSSSPPLLLLSPKVRCRSESLSAFMWVDLEKALALCRDGKSCFTCRMSLDEGGAASGLFSGCHCSLCGWFLPEIHLGITGAQQRFQVKRMIGGIGNVPCSTYSQTLNG